MRTARSPHNRRLRTAAVATALAGAVLTLSACSGAAGGSEQTAGPGPVTPTVSAEFVSPSARVAPTSGSVTAGSEMSTASAATPSTPVTTEAVETTSDSAAVATSPTLLPEVTAPTDVQEIAGRQAVEAAWVRFWDYYPTFEELSLAERQEIAEAISVDPLKTQILDGAASADAGGRTGYGTVTHRISWYQSIDGQQQIAMADCMDQSTAGSMDKASGKKLTKGFPRENLRGDLVFSADEGWRVRNLYYLTDQPC